MGNVERERMSERGFGTVLRVVSWVRFRSTETREVQSPGILR